MELNVTDYNEAIIKWCNTILGCHYNLLFLTEDYSKDKVRENRALIDRNLVRMHLSAQKIIGLVFPIPNAGEIHGLPKEATMAADDPDVIVVDRENPNWDFRPWFGEKSGVLKEAVNKLMDYLETEYDPQVVTHLSETEWEKSVGGTIRSNMREIKGKANALLEMIETDRLVIKDVRVEEQEEDEWEEE